MDWGRDREGVAVGRGDGNQERLGCQMSYDLTSIVDSRCQENAWSGTPNVKRRGGWGLCNGLRHGLRGW